MTALTSSTFPPGFLWGAAIGAHQSEGNNIASDWWDRENAAGTAIRERNGDAIDSYHRWPEDLDLAADAGLTDYRFGVEWARVEPEDGHISLAAVAHYRRIVAGAIARGLRPMVTLHHFTNPRWFARSGGWLRPDAASRFLRYVDAVAPVLGAGVQHIGTINEPNVVATSPRRAGAEELATAGLPEPDPALTEALIRVHRTARDRIRRDHPDVLVGWGVSVQDYQARPGAEEALASYALARDEVFLHVSREDDWVGVQAYTRGVIGRDGVPVRAAGAELTQTGWENYPRALGGAVRRAARAVGRTPIIVTENGIATADDDQRVAFTTTALLSLREAMDDGVDVRGYLHWSMLDNWEWGSWTPAFGLVAVNRTTFDRTPKPSLAWLGSLAPERP